MVLIKNVGGSERPGSPHEDQGEPLGSLKDWTK